MVICLQRQHTVWALVCAPATPLPFQLPAGKAAGGWVGSSDSAPTWEICFWLWMNSVTLGSYGCEPANGQSLFVSLPICKSALQIKK